MRNRGGICLLSGSKLAAQNVGIGTASPSERLHVQGNLRLEGAFMPGNAPGSKGALLRSEGANTPPIWIAPTGAGQTITSNQSGTDFVAAWANPDTLYWKVRGNAGTDPTVHFVGTTDNRALVIRTNNVQRLQFNTNGSIQRDNGGNQRGTDAIDFQVLRSSPTQVASGARSFIAAGDYNTASGNMSFVGAGRSNIVSGSYAATLGGLRDTAAGFTSFVIGGQDNYVDVSGGIIGGRANRALSGSGAIPIIIGGDTNTARGTSAIINSYRSTTAGALETIISGFRCGIGRGGACAIVGSFGSYINPNGNPPGSWADGNVILGGGEHYIHPENTQAGGFNAILGGGVDTIRNGSFNAIIASTHSSTENIQKGVLIGCRLCNLRGGFYQYAFGRGVRPTSTNGFRMYIFGDNSNIPGAFFGDIDEGTPGQPIPASSGRVAINRLDEPQHPLHIGTNTGNGNGAHVTNGGVWTNASSIAFKERFVDLDREDILARVRRLTLKGWYYKGTEEYHIGPIAEEFYQLFHTGVQTDPEVSRYISSVDPAGVALISIQALAERSDRQANRLEALQEEVQRLKEMVEMLRQENARLRAVLPADTR